MIHAERGGVEGRVLADDMLVATGIGNAPEMSEQEALREHQRALESTAVFLDTIVSTLAVEKT
eukprot:1006833-Alexandrium_andersonii.AAC.1